MEAARVRIRLCRLTETHSCLYSSPQVRITHAHLDMCSCIYLHFVEKETVLDSKPKTGTFGRVCVDLSRKVILVTLLP